MRSRGSAHPGRHASKQEQRPNHHHWQRLRHQLATAGPVPAPPQHSHTPRLSRPPHPTPPPPLPSPRPPACPGRACEGSSPASHEVHTPRRRRLKGVAHSTIATASWARAGWAARLEAMEKRRGWRRGAACGGQAGRQAGRAGGWEQAAGCGGRGEGWWRLRWRCGAERQPGVLSSGPPPACPPPAAAIPAAAAPT